ncbi:MAG: amidohydrolase family protein [Chitinophagaceae bacterium]|nr:amidohydrolase family protein [Chitinophagaceae bacterium]
MKKIFLVISSFILLKAQAQETILPVPSQSQTIVLYNGTLHKGNGEVITNAVVIMEKGKITYAGPMVASDFKDAKIIDVAGKHIYPGLILPTSNLGLVGISAVRASSDVQEIGEFNPNVRSIVAYNTDSKVINTLRSNGILLANIVPQGSLLAGSSSVVQLDAWNWEDAAYKTDAGMHLYMPSMMAQARGRFGGFGGGGTQTPSTDPVKEALENVEGSKGLLRMAKAYLNETSHEETNLKFEATKGLYNKTQKLYVHANTVKQMLVALDFVKEFGFDLVIVGGSDSYQVADLLKQNNVSVILNQPHSLPTAEDDDVDQPYKTAAALQKAGVNFAISDDDAQTRGRNLAFNAGTAVTYGLTKEEALAAITLNAAKIMGVADKTGSIEAGKDANIIVSDGDILDMRTSNVTDAFIQGRKIDLNDKHKQLYEKYQQKYNLKKGF